MFVKTWHRTNGSKINCLRKIYCRFCKSIASTENQGFLRRPFRARSTFLVTIIFRSSNKRLQWNQLKHQWCLTILVDAPLQVIMLQRDY